MRKIHLKYIDDMTEAFAINVKEVTTQNSNLVRPVRYHERTEHVLSEHVRLDAQSELDNVAEYCKTHEMQINVSKSKVMMFNNSRTVDFMPILRVGKDSNPLDVVSEYKLLGVIVQKDLKWAENTRQLCIKGFGRLWILRRLKGLGANTSELLDVYIKQIRSVLEMAVPVWEPGLNIREKGLIERVQKAAFNIILGPEYQDYGQALKYLKMQRLSVRRTDICLKFAKKSYKDPKYQSWFVRNPEATHVTRSKKDILKPILSRTRNYEQSPLPFLTTLLNENFKLAF